MNRGAKKNEEQEQSSTSREGEATSKLSNLKANEARSSLPSMNTTTWPSKTEEKGIEFEAIVNAISPESNRKLNYNQGISNLQ